MWRIVAFALSFYARSQMIHNRIEKIYILEVAGEVNSFDQDKAGGRLRERENIEHEEIITKRQMVQIGKNWTKKIITKSLLIKLILSIESLKKKSRYIQVCIQIEKYLI